MAAPKQVPVHGGAVATGQQPLTRDFGAGLSSSSSSSVDQWTQVVDL